MRWLILVALAAPAAAEIAVPARTLPARHVIAPGDLVAAPGDVPGALSDPALALGLETRVALYAGRPVNPADLAPPAAVERNAVISLIYTSGGLVIETEGRALGRGAAGDRIRVLNLASRATVDAVLGADGAAHVN